MIKRYYNLEKFMKPNKVLIIYGPRRVGKTTLLNEFLSRTKLKYKLDSGDNISVQQILGSQDELSGQKKETSKEVKKEEAVVTSEAK